MLIKKLTFAAAAFCFALSTIAARAQDAGALLDLLVKKRLITDQEAEEVRGELIKARAAIVLSAKQKAAAANVNFLISISFS